MAYIESLTALADPTRRALFEAVAEAPRPVGELAQILPVSRPAVSQHLKVLSDAGLVMVRAEGTKRIYAVRPEGLRDLRAWLERYWDKALSNFSDEIDRMQRSEYD